jgi:hypothetical protein
MSNTIAIRPAEPAATVAIRGEGRSSNELMSWAYAARQAHEIAVQLAETSFVPKAMYRRPGEVTGAILAGRELGLSPMSALSAIDIIDGTPALRAHALRGLVQSHGHEVWVEESTETRAVVCGQRMGSSRIEKSTWTMDRAKKAGLAGKRNWVTHPTAMLIARATSEVCRLIAADVLLGMPYSVEEIGDGLPDQPAEAPTLTKAAQKRTAQRARPVAEPPPADVDFDAPPPAPSGAPPVVNVELPAEDFPEAAEPDEAQAVEAPDEDQAIENLRAAGLDPQPVDPRITDAQRARLGVAFRQVGILARDDRLAFASEVVGRRLESSNELTVREASDVIHALVRRLEEQ